MGLELKRLYYYKQIAPKGHISKKYKLILAQYEPTVCKKVDQFFCELRRSDLFFKGEPNRFKFSAIINITLKLTYN